MNINKHIFEANPVSLDISRSKFDLSHGWKGTFNTGLAVPMLAYSDILPGSTWKLSASCVIRSTTPVAPVMDTAYADVYFFFVPHKLTLSREMMSPAVDNASRSWAAFIGAQDSLLNMPLPGDVRLPGISFGKIDRIDGAYVESGFSTGSLADYLALPDFAGTFPAATGPRFMNCLEPLAYYSVWNSYFRDPSTTNPISFTITSDTLYGGNPRIVLNGAPVNGYWSIGDPECVLPVSRFHGYFGSALPWPQRNSTEVTLPLGDSAPVIPSGSIAYGDDTLVLGSNISGGGISSYGFPIAPSSMDPGDSWVNPPSPETYGSVNGTNLKADLSAATAASVNALRFAVQAQRWYEALARGGNRLDEMTASMFGVTPSDAGTGRPEYLGGKRIMINVQQVENTAGTTESTVSQMAIGSTGAYSLTTDNDRYFTKSFDTWGSVIGIVCVRTAESFHQGLARRHSRFDRFDFYWPQFANLGEQPIKNKEIYMDGSADDEKPFGYQEAWAEYRFFPDSVTGLARPGSNQAYWTYANNFTSRPNLKDYLDASNQKANVDRTLQVPSEDAGFQWLADFHFDIQAVLPMPTYSIPGLVDHH